MGLSGCRLPEDIAKKKLTEALKRSLSSQQRVFLYGKESQIKKFQNRNSQHKWRFPAEGQTIRFPLRLFFRSERFQSFNEEQQSRGITVKTRSFYLRKMEICGPQAEVERAKEIFTPIFEEYDSEVITETINLDSPDECKKVLEGKEIPNVVIAGGPARGEMGKLELEFKVFFFSFFFFFFPFLMYSLRYLIGKNWNKLMQL